MSYIGRNIENLSDRAVLDSISTSATATFNLLLNSVAYVPSSAESLTVSLNGIIQSPGSSYSVSGSTIVFASNLASSDVIDFILAERAITLTTIGSGTVTTSNIVDANVTTAKIADNAVTSAKLASGLLPTNTPAFFAYLGSNQTISSNTYTKITFDTEIVDTNNNFASNRFTPTTSGKYIIYANVCFDASSSQFAQGGTAIYKNGSILYETFNNQTSNNANTISLPIQVLVDANGSGDYFEIFAKCTDSSGSPVISAGNRRTTFGAYKLIGV